MSVKLLTKQHLEFLSLKGATQARLSLHLSKCHIVGNRMSRLILRLHCTHVAVRLYGPIKSFPVKAKIWNRYNYVPYLTQNTIWESDKNTRKHCRTANCTLRKFHTVKKLYLFLTAREKLVLNMIKAHAVR